jgi:hypothetical protein
MKPSRQAGRTRRHPTRTGHANRAGQVSQVGWAGHPREANRPGWPGQAGETRRAGRGSGLPGRCAGLAYRPRARGVPAGRGRAALRSWARLSRCAAEWAGQDWSCEGPEWRSMSVGLSGRSVSGTAGRQRRAGWVSVNRLWATHRSQSERWVGRRCQFCRALWPGTPARVVAHFALLGSAADR